MEFFFEAILVGFILCLDSFSAALAMGHRPFQTKEALTFAFASGLAEALVALVGALAGNQIVRYLGSIDHWIAFILLIGVALHMAFEGVEELRNPAHNNQLTFHSFTKIIVVSFATSLDALGIGISLGVSHKPLVAFIFSIGLWAFVATIVGLYLSKKLSSKLGAYMNFLGAIVLTIMAFEMLKI